MCNEYELKLREEEKALRHLVRNMLHNQLVPQSVFPNTAAPIIVGTPEGRVMQHARWGMPSPPKFIKNRDPGVTNIRNVSSPHWRRWLGPEHRCLVPFTRFAENEALPDGSHPPVYFALGKNEPLAFFAGIWVSQWKSVRKVKDGETTDDLYGFLTTEPNAEVGAVHPKAMPVILTTDEQCDAWMTAPASEIPKLQRPLPDGALTIVQRGRKAA